MYLLIEVGIHISMALNLENKFIKMTFFEFFFAGHAKKSKQNGPSSMLCIGHLRQCGIFGEILPKTVVFFLDQTLLYILQLTTLSV